ncbi:ATP-binding cassette domain-containing protein [Acetonema longum]|uniref:ABC transporter n=1 Tax=Acetonema longum DSM 6540 TaxID=1009370 RepID=F7NG90_9FIRM|nr:ATP-binding cassette domain-containing protein [Acetonema longum]EGO65008.1 ABC transporter [Acetonema longum DSM 6540]
MLTANIEKKLPDFTLTMQFTMQNEVLVLFGPSGCGKTTTLRCIAGLAQPDQGKVSLNGDVFFDSQVKENVPPRLRKMGYMFQDFALFPHMSVKKNIGYGIKQPGKKADELYTRLLDLLKISHLTDRYPHSLSGGERQRVALARALMAEPSVLLLDEPMSSLDSETRRELQDELKRLHTLWQIPFILVTHDLHEARKLGDRIVFMEQGRQVEGR